MIHKIVIIEKKQEPQQIKKLKMDSLKNLRLERFKDIDIYPVISHEFCGNTSPLEVLEKVAEGGAKIVQLREKHMNKNELYTLGLEFRKLTAARGMLLIINDYTDVALAVNADGVHLGQSDLPLEAAKKIAPDIIFGNSTHSMSEAFQAVKKGADYINIGPVFPTKTKELSVVPVGTELLKQVSEEIHIPFTVMGGIKEKNIPELIASGVRKVAMVTEVTLAENIPEKVRRIRKLLLS